MGLQDYIQEDCKIYTIQTSVWAGSSGSIGLFNTYFFAAITNMTEDDVA
jgi:hypothetical protein